MVEQAAHGLSGTNKRVMPVRTEEALNPLGCPLLEQANERTVMRLADKVAIISGAASGMGAATAHMFAREGAKVVIADVLEHEGRQVADAIGAAARYEPLDVTKEESWATVVAATT
ncbi:MAG TPA: SDR family NAD(P)-dependent oxidoreductase, partial [Xanthobacteraceae bacterium]|nr:SDR family NAD(P)-dependent oxidoreductase [Xanthobacteraceae bacterium]